jgi:hypothetical protein
MSGTNDPERLPDHFSQTMEVVLSSTRARPRRPRWLTRLLPAPTSRTAR